MNSDSYLSVPRHPEVSPRDLTGGMQQIVADYQMLRNVLRLRMPAWFPVGSRVRFPASYGGTTGTVDGYVSNEPAAVRVRVDVEPGVQPRTVFVWANHLTELLDGE